MRRRHFHSRRTLRGGSSSLPGPEEILGANYRLDYNPLPGNIVLNGSDVAGWVNSGLAAGVDPAQATPAQQPLYVPVGALNGKPCVRFTRANGDLLTVAAGGPSQLAAHSIFVVATLNLLPTQYTGFFGVGDNTASSGVGVSNGNLSWFGGANLLVPTGAAVSATGYRFGKMATAGGATQGYRNGAVDGSAAVNAYNSATNVTIGSYTPAGTSAFGCIDADIYRIIGVDSLLNGQQFLALEAYFLAEYF